jgi:single-stranded DNA-binding protein
MLKTTFTGNLLADPEMNYAQNDRGTEYVKLRVGLNKKKGDNKLFAVADVTIFKFTQEAMDRLHTGSRVLIVGDGFPDFYEQKDGTIVAKIDVVADAWEDLSPREGNGQGEGQGRTQSQQSNGYGRRPQQQNGNGRSGGSNARERTGGGNTNRRPARAF